MPKYYRSWFKGADTSTLCIYLESMLRDMLPIVPESHREYVNLIVAALKNANLFMRTLLHSGLFLLESERNTAIAAGSKVMSFFKRLAGMAYVMQLTRWKLQPKYHYMAEVIFAMEYEKQQDLPSLNPLSTATQLDEDFVGRVAGASRTVSSRATHVRTIERFLLELQLKW